MPKQKIVILIIAIFLAAMSVFMVKSYIEQQQRIMQEQTKRKLEEEKANQAVVLLAKQEISRGSPIYPEMLYTAIVPKKFVQPQALTSSDSVAGMVAAVTISKDDQLTLNKLAYPKQAIGSSLSSNTPVGKRAITISVDNIASLVGMIRPSDYVDVVGVLSVPKDTSEGKRVTQPAVVPLFQNVLVLAVGQETSAVSFADARYKKTERKEISPFITLALTPQEANLIAFVQEQGKIRLFLRSPNDSQIETIPSANWDTLLRYGIPKEAARPTSKEEVEAKGYIEIYRGLTKERIPLYK